METTLIPNNQLCFITICFPFDNDAEVLAVRTKVSEALREVKRVKLELRITEMRDGG